MRRGLRLSLASIVIAAGGQAAAQEEFAGLPRITGHGSLWGGFGSVANNSGGQDLCIGPDCSNTFDSDTPFLFGGDLQIGGRWTPRFSTQLDLLGRIGEDWSTDPLLEPEKRDGFAGGTVGLHLSLRDYRSFLVGPFGALTVGSLIGAPDTPLSGMAGVEAMRILDRTTLYLQAGYFDALDYDSYNSIIFGDLWFVRGVDRHFPDPDTRLQIEAMYGEGRDQIEFDDGTGGDRFQLASWGVEIARRIRDTRVSLFAAYDGLYMFDPYETIDDVTPEDSDTLFQHTMRLGIRLHFGARTLAEENAAGANLDLPEFTQPLALYKLFDEYSEDF